MLKKAQADKQPTCSTFHPLLSPQSIAHDNAFSPPKLCRAANMTATTSSKPTLRHLHRCDSYQ